MTMQIKYPSIASEFVALRSYCRWLPELSRRETWSEVVSRVMTFLKTETRHADRIPNKVWTSIEEGIASFNTMPSMRLVATAGPAAKKDNICIYNCSYLPIDSMKSFSELLYVLMCGTGVGYSVERENIEKLPTIKHPSSQKRNDYVIEDSREGWAKALLFGIETWYNGEDVRFDSSKLRGYGEPLKTMGGRSSGPDPLKDLLKFTKDIIMLAAGRKLNSLECHDICCKCAEVVVVGGSRRSACISFSDLDDELMRHAKDFPFPPHRYMSNNSAVYKNKPDDIIFLKEWSALAESGSGERGILNVSNLEAICKDRKFTKDMRTNPCLTKWGKVKKKNGKTFDIINIEDLKVGDEIWSKEGWTKVIKKWSNGIKEIYRYNTDINGKLDSFELTNNHRIISNGNKIEIKDADSIDYFPDMSKKKTKNIKIVSSEYYTTDEVFDITVDNKTHTFWYCGYDISNCGEIILRPYGACNLSEAVVRADDDIGDLVEKVKTATWLGVIQATFTNFPFLRPEWKKNAEEERLIGVSLTGQLDNPEILTEQVLKQLKKVAIKTAKHAADILKIPTPKAYTCVKPSGTVSQVVDSASGCHPRFSKFYIRRYRISSSDPLFQLLRDQGVNYKPENGQTEDNATTFVLEFPIKAPDKAITTHNWSSTQQLAWYLKLQKNWSTHNVSNTCYVRANEWIKTGAWVLDNFDEVVGISFLPLEDHKYSLAPYEEIDEKTYEHLLKEFPKLDFSVLGEYEKLAGDKTEAAKNLACSAGGCELK